MTTEAFMVLRLKLKWYTRCTKKYTMQNYEFMVGCWPADEKNRCGETG